MAPPGSPGTRLTDGPRRRGGTSGEQLSRTLDLTSPFLVQVSFGYRPGDGYHRDTDGVRRPVRGPYRDRPGTRGQPRHSEIALGTSRSDGGDLDRPRPGHEAPAAALPLAAMHHP